MSTSTEYPIWAFPVMTAVLVYLVAYGWRRKDIYSNLKVNFSLPLDNALGAVLRNKIEEINNLNKTVLTVSDLFCLSLKGICLPVVRGTSTVTGGHWMGLRAYTYSGVYTVATDLKIRELLNGSPDIFKQASEPELSDVYFVTSMEKLQRLVAR